MILKNRKVELCKHVTPPPPPRGKEIVLDITEVSTSLWVLQEKYNNGNTIVL